MTIKCPHCGVEQDDVTVCSICGQAIDTIPESGTRKIPTKPSHNPLFVVAALLIASGVIFWIQGRTGKEAVHGDRGKVPWVMDYEQGFDMALEDDRPVMLFFTASWCGYCKKMLADAFSDDVVVQAISRVVPIFVDVDQRSDLMESYSIRGVPAIIFLTPEKKILYEMSGQRDGKSVITMINQVAPAR